MLPERIEVHGNHAEAMKFIRADWAMPDISFVTWMQNRLVATRGEVAILTFESNALTIASKEETVRIENGDWLVLFDEGAIWHAAEAEFESIPSLKFLTNQGRPLDISSATIDEASAKPGRFGFSYALIHLKGGGRVAREGWNGKSMWLLMVNPPLDAVQDAYVDAEPRTQWDLQMCAKLDVDRFLPWIGMRTADSGFVPWLASQTDLLAEDWQIVT